MPLGIDDALMVYGGGAALGALGSFLAASLKPMLSGKRISRMLSLPGNRGRVMTTLSTEEPRTYHVVVLILLWLLDLLLLLPARFLCKLLRILLLGMQCAPLVRLLQLGRRSSRD